MAVTRVYKKQWTPHVKNGIDTACKQKQWPPLVKKRPADSQTTMAEFPTRIFSFFKTRGRHENVRTEILYKKLRSTASHLSRGLFPLPFLCLCHGPQTSTPIPKNVFATKLLAPKFCAECTDKQLHSSHGGYFRCHFCVYVSGPLSSDLGHFLVNFWTTFRQLGGQVTLKSGLET